MIAARTTDRHPFRLPPQRRAGAVVARQASRAPLPGADVEDDLFGMAWMTAGMTVYGEDDESGTADDLLMELPERACIRPGCVGTAF